MSDLENGRADPGVEVGEDVRAPQPLRDVFARHQFLSALQQEEEEEIHRLPRERKALPLASQLVGRAIDLELSEAVRHAGAARAHA
jgi:hypothetical protein